MALQRTLAVLAPGARVLSPRLVIVVEEGKLVVHNGADPVFHCRADDRAAIRFAAGMFGSLRLAADTALAEGLGISRETVRRHRQLLQDGGAQALQTQRPGPKAPFKLTEAVQLRAQLGLDQGWSVRRAAAQVGLTEGALRYHLRQGRLQPPRSARRRQPASSATGPTPAPEATAQPPSSPAQRAAADQSCPQGVGVKRTLERALAATGKLVEAVPQFHAAEAVAGAGVLLALPALLEQGLLAVTEQVFGQLRHGFYGLRAVLLTFAFMALLRLRNPEQLKGRAPGERGLLLGLDRAPEVKSLRRKLEELGLRGLGRPRQQELAERWSQAEPEQLGLLYVDGHVPVYNGRKHQLHHVQKRGRPLPGTQDFYVNDARAEPLFVVTAAATESLLAMMEQELLPEIRYLLGDPVRRVTVVVDRQGWSPKAFARWYELGFDVLTYRKGQQSRWQERCFTEGTDTIDGRQVVYQLAERRVTLSNGLRVREVRRLTEDGHQTAVITTHDRLSTCEVAERMFSRWRQENFFRYMRHEFDLDPLCTYDVEPGDPQRLVPHPERSRLERQLKTKQATLDRVVGRGGDLKPAGKLRLQGRSLTEDEADEWLRTHEQEIRRLKQPRAALPAEVPLAQVLAPEQIVQLDRQRKLLTDVLMMIGYRAESQIAPWVAPAFKRHQDETRNLLQAIFQATADRLPDHRQGTLTVRFHRLSTPRATRALSALCQTATDQQLHYPGTSLRLLSQAPVCHTN